ncbi:Helix-turn-helix domain-containing protein [Halopseudomonas sabulinigri]|uniref:Helix-turn-helix domain-containing protein n=1 Tax=Halopseudomonas sabulinigri TaxID=472181 RepID=A0A1H1RQC9_9GAMM|nr:AraC family transcriptional regulator ligand-binding domain-containing protein [Halopseudomonas sabulinigri]SDS37971.1 Helix-turn-helix domain-containing protein [Halopseudomonas sabulinigri]
MEFNSKVIPLHLNPLGFIEGFVQLGVSMPALLAGTGIDPGMFADPAVRISYGQQYRLLRNGLRLTDHPAPGLSIGMQVDWSHFGLIGYVVHCSPSLSEAAEAFMRYQMIAQPFYTVTAGRPVGFIDRDDRFVFPLRCFPPPEADERSVEQFELDFRLATTLRLCVACGNHQVPDTQVHVELTCVSPPHAQLYNELPCASVRFAAKRNAVVVNRRFRIEPFRLTRQAAFRELIARCELDLQAAGLEPTTTAAVRSQLTQRFNRRLQLMGSRDYQEQPLTLAACAQALRLTPRALARRLGQEHSSFRQILQEVRVAFALHHLQASSLRVDDIAELSGFSSASSMRRAVRQSNGKVPGLKTQNVTR